MVFSLSGGLLKKISSNQVFEIQTTVLIAHKDRTKSRVLRFEKIKKKPK